MAPGYIPTPEQIEAAAAAIRAEWTPEQARGRECVPAVPWSVPDVKAVGVRVREE